MKQLNKAILVPVLSTIALIVKYVVGIEVPDVAVDLAADLILGAITFVGIFMQPQVDKKEAKINDPAKYFGDHGPSV